MLQSQTSQNCFRWRHGTKQEQLMIWTNDGLADGQEYIALRCCLNYAINTLRPRQNGRYSPDDIFKCIFLNENVWISIKISLKFVCQGPIHKIPTLVQIMAWRRPGGDKALSGPMMARLPTHICVTWPQWVNEYTFGFYIFWMFNVLSSHR